MIFIYYSYLSAEKHDDLLKDHLSKFSVSFRQKITRYRRWQDAQLSLIGRLLLYRAMRELELNVTENDSIRFNAYNKPYFDNCPAYFNISHSGDIAVCAISLESEIGIDIERMTDIEIEVFKCQMNEYEWANVLTSGNSKHAFYDYWTQKEAVIKAQGSGLSLGLKSFFITEGRTTIGMDEFFIKEIMIDPVYKCYVSLKTPIPNVSLIKI